MIGFAGLWQLSFAEMNYPDALKIPFNDSDLVLVGTIISKDEISKNQTKYGIDVENYLKNSKSFDMISAISYETKNQTDTYTEVHYYNEPFFDVGQKVFVYLKMNKSGEYTMSPYSFAIEKNEPKGPPPSVIWMTGPTKFQFNQGEEVIISGLIKKAYLYDSTQRRQDPSINLKIFDKNNELLVSEKLNAKVDGTYDYQFQIKGESRIPGKYSYEIQLGPETMNGEFIIEINPNLWTPLKQFKSGVLLTNIQCRDGLQLMIKSENGLPACVTTQNMEKLAERGWGKPLSNILEIPSPKISQTDAIKIIENDLKNRESNSTKILKIVDIIGDRDRYVPFSEFQTNNGIVPLVFVSKNDTLLTINNASLRINYLCNMGTIAYCGYMPPFNLDYKNRLVYGFDIVYGDNDANTEPSFYAVDAVSGDIVDSGFLRNEAREK